MSIFDAYRQQPQQQQQQQRITPQQAMQQLRQSPAGTLRQAGFQIPDGMSDPQQMVMHLMQSGQVSNQRINMVRQMMGR